MLLNLTQGAFKQLGVTLRLIVPLVLDPIGDICGLPLKH